MSQKSKYAIETISLTKAFKDWWGRTKVLAVDDLNLTVNHNEVYGLLGPNGSGKSTTIKMLLSLLKPTKGVCFVLGGDSSDPAISSKVGFLPEESYLYKYLSARETLQFYGNLFGLPKKVMESRIEALLDMVGLSGMSNRPIGTFSKGMQRRIGLAQALINDPDLLILDEPTSGLDPLGTRQIKDIIKSLSSRGKTILMCSHLLADVEDVCDRISILYGGKMQTEGNVRELLQCSDKHQIVSSALSDDAIEKIKAIAKSESKDVEVNRPMASLEDLFVDIVNKAQAAHQSTSGAVSTTKVGDFLKQVSNQEGVLDKLVSADVVSEPVKEDKEPSVSVEAVELDKTDNTLLDNLAGAEIETESVDLEKPVVEERPAEDVNKDLLKDLMKGPDTPEKKAKEIEDE